MYKVIVIFKMLSTGKISKEEALDQLKQFYNNDIPNDIMLTFTSISQKLGNSPS